MTKEEFVRNTRIDGVPSEILEVNTYYYYTLYK
jgi:hypothetical protein